MHSSRLASAALIVLLLAGACSAERKVSTAEATRNSEALVTAEIARLDGELKRLEEATLPSGFEPLVKQLRVLLERSRASDSAELRLYRLRDPFAGIEALRFMTANSGAMNDLVIFEKVWQENRKAFDEVAPVRGGTLQRALHQAAANRAQVLARASLPYGRSSGPADGLYYFGEAEGNRRFAAFVASLDWPADGNAPGKPAIAAALDDLERDTLTAFDRDPSGKTTIPTSARLKEARELLARGWTDGATLTLLEARLELSRRAASPAPAKATGVAKPSGGGGIAALLRAMARDSNAADAVKADVIPLFNTLYTVTAAKPVPIAPVVVTLVRWPYT
jgi:hypothetical protein